MMMGAELSGYMRALWTRRVSYLRDSEVQHGLTIGKVFSGESIYCRSGSVAKGSTYITAVNTGGQWGTYVGGGECTVDSRGVVHVDNLIIHWG